MDNRTVSINIQGKGEKALPFYFISDVHVSTVRSDHEDNKQKLLTDLFSRIGQSGGTLFILGDFFDFWFDFRGFVHPALKDIMNGLHNLSESGVEIHYIAGNHDFWIRDTLKRLPGMYFYEDHITFAQGGMSFYLCHGDGLLAADNGYRVLKKILRNPIAIFGFRLLGRRLGYLLGEKANDRSRDSYIVKIPHLKSYAEEMMQWMTERNREGYRIVMMGHIHYPVREEDEKGLRLIMGDWIVDDHRYYGLWDGLSFDHIRIK